MTALLVTIVVTAAVIGVISLAGMVRLKLLRAADAMLKARERRS